MKRMQHNSFFLGCNHLNRDITTDARTGYRLYPVQDIDSVLTSGGGGGGHGSNVNVDDTLSLLFGGICFRQLKETLKHTMLVHESVFESQIHELHRLYQRQKELMMEMEGSRQQDEEEALYLNSSVPSPTTHWMSSNVSIYQTRNFPCEQQQLMPNQTEAVSDVKKPEKLVLDLELPVLECHDGEEETSLVNGQVREVASSLESGSKSNKLQFDLNEPAEIEEHYEFTSPVSSVESDKKNEGEGSCWMYEAQGIGIDLNLFPLSSEEEVCIVKKLGEEKPQECLSEKSRALVQALPCLNSTLLMNKPHDSYKPRKKKKKVKLGPVNKAFKGSDLDLHASAQDKGSSSSVRKQSKAVAKKKRKKSRRLCFVKERNHGEISAAEAMVDMSRKSDREASEFITSSLSKNLHLLAEVSSLAVGGYELDYTDATTLQLTEMNLEDRKTTLRSNTADNKTAVSSIVLKKQKRRSYDKDNQLHTFSECEANEEDLQVKVDEVSDQEGDCEFFPKKKKRRSSPLKRIEDLTWGARSKRRLGSRIPATDFQHMIINQIV